MTQKTKVQFVITDVAHFMCFSKSFLGDVALKIAEKRKIWRLWTTKGLTSMFSERTVVWS